MTLSPKCNRYTWFNQHVKNAKPQDLNNLKLKTQKSKVTLPRWLKLRHLESFNQSADKMAIRLRIDRLHPSSEIFS